MRTAVLERRGKRQSLRTRRNTEIDAGLQEGTGDKGQGTRDKESFMADISRTDLLAFMRQQQYAVQASVSASGTPQVAVVGIVVSDRVEVFFDTLASSRKAVNLRHNPAIALAIGSNADGAERSVQLEGIADEPRG